MTRPHRGMTAAAVLCCFLAGPVVLPAMAQERAGEVLKQFEQHETAPKARPLLPVVESDVEKERRKQRRITPEDGTPILIKSIVVKDSDHLLTPDEISAVIRPAEGRQQTLAELLVLADRLTAILRSKGYITSYAYIPQQEIENGLLSIGIMTGVLGNVTVIGNRSYHDGFIRGHLEKLRKEGVLNEAGLMGQLLILNEHPSLEARASLKAGTTAGTTDIRLAVQDRRPLFGSLSYDNFGNSNISRDRLSVGFGAGNLALDGDLLSLSGTMGLRKIDIDTLAYGRVEYAVPINYQGTRLGLYYSNSLYRASGELSSLDFNGKSNLAGLYLTHPLLRRASDYLTLKVGFDYKDVNDYVLGTLNSRDRIRTLTTELSYDGIDRLGGRNVIGIGWITGLQPLVGGTGAGDSGTSRLHAGGGFSRFTLDAQRDQGLGGGHRLVLRAGGQYSADELFVAEQYSLGGVYSVRGYRPAFRSGDSGYTTSAELHLALRSPATPPAQAGAGFLPAWNEMSLFLIPFLDHGGVYRNNPQPGEAADSYLTALGTGLRLHWGRWTARFDYAVPETGGWKIDNALAYLQVTASF